MIRSDRYILRCLVVLLGAMLLGPGPLAAQLAPPSTGGVPAMMRELAQLGHYERVLMIGAHPDDEDTQLLTILSRGMGARTAYLSLTRGEGGQDLIGPELGDALGILRTEELLAARRIDGSQQFFSRAYDFGFSKTIDDAWKHWPRDSVLKDVVRIIRRFRPQVVVSVFSGTPRDGHGQHQAAGWAARRAFEVAGDPAVFPELGTEEGLAPWTPLKLYRSARFDPGARMITLDGGAVDPVTGKTFRQLAMEGRSLHRSQKMGQLQPMGPSVSRVVLWEDRTGHGDDGFWSGVDTLVTGYPAVAGLPEKERAAVTALLVRYAAQVAALRAGFPYARAGSALPRIDSAVVTLEQVRARIAAARAGTAALVQEELDGLHRLRFAAADIAFDAIVATDRVVPGAAVGVELLTRNAGAAPAPLRIGVTLGEGFLATGPGSGDTVLPAGALWSDSLTVRASADAAPTQPYFLAAPRTGWLYTWPRSAMPEWGMPFGPPGIQGWAGGPSQLRREASARVNDPASGEIRPPVFIVPRVSVKLAPEETLIPLGRGAVTFTVTLEHAGRDSTAGEVRLDLPDGWQKPAPQPFILTRPDEERSFTFEVRPPADARAGSATVRAVAVDSKGVRYGTGIFRVEYPHIHPRQYARPATARVVLADVTFPPVHAIGYVRGAADHEPEALIAAGLPVTILDSATLASGDLSRFDAIVVGPRAYEVDTTLLRHNDRLLAYARDGGRVVVQYQQQVFFAGGYAPYPLSLGGRNDRTTDETAPVTVLAPDSPDLRTPNRIGPEDWDGWIQERSLYCAHTWDPHYEPILAMADPGEAPISGCLLEAVVGRGSWVYNALAFHRQLPGAVPGAFRLFVDLLGGRPRP